MHDLLNEAHVLNKIVELNIGLKTGRNKNEGLESWVANYFD